MAAPGCGRRRSSNDGPDPNRAPWDQDACPSSVEPNTTTDPGRAEPFDWWAGHRLVRSMFPAWTPGGFGSGSSMSSPRIAIAVGAGATGAALTVTRGWCSGGGEGQLSSLGDGPGRHPVTCRELGSIPGWRRSIPCMATVKARSNGESSPVTCPDRSGGSWKGWNRIR